MTEDAGGIGLRFAFPTVCELGVSVHFLSFPRKQTASHSLKQAPEPAINPGEDAHSLHPRICSGA